MKKVKNIFMVLLLVVPILAVIINFKPVKADSPRIVIVNCPTNYIELEFGKSVTLSVDEDPDYLEWYFAGDTHIDPVINGNSVTINAIGVGTGGTVDVLYDNGSASGRATCNIEVVPPIVNLSIAACPNGKVDVFVGDTVTLKASGASSNYMSWVFSGDTIIDPIGGNGKDTAIIKGLKEGRATAIVEYSQDFNGEESYSSYECEINVKKKPVVTPTPSPSPSPSPSPTPKPQETVTQKPTTTTETTKPAETAKPDSTTSTKKSDNNNLKSLSVKDYAFVEKFDSKISTYNVIVPTKLSSITINAIVEDKTAKVTGTGSKKITSNNQKFIVKVTSESGKVKEYTINVTKQDTPVKINSLEVSNYKLNETFNPEKTSYTLTVPNEVEKLDVKALADEDVKISISGNQSLVVGVNTIHVVATNKDGQTKTYSLVVTREKAKEEVDESNNTTQEVSTSVIGNNKKDNTPLVIGVAAAATGVASIGVVTFYIKKIKK